jgi:hypothetical protein
MTHPPAQDAADGLTTSAALIAFRNELIAGGFPEHIADEMACEASTVIIKQEGTLVVSPE